jgi:hypothetical protein
MSQWYQFRAQAKGAAEIVIYDEIGFKSGRTISGCEPPATTDNSRPGPPRPGRGVFVLAGFAELQNLGDVAVQLP